MLSAAAAAVPRAPHSVRIRHAQWRGCAPHPVRRREIFGGFRPDMLLHEIPHFIAKMRLTVSQCEVHIRQPLVALVFPPYRTLESAIFILRSAITMWKVTRTDAVVLEYCPYSIF
jgi:hypothetical protein